MPARTATVTNICALPGSPLKPITKGPVSAKLNTISFTVDGTTEKARHRYTDVDPVTGSWSMVLELNDDLDPAGTSWVIKEPTGATWTVQLVAANAGQTVNLRDVIVADPLNPNPIVAGASIAALSAESSARVSGDAATLASAASDATTKANAAQSAAISTASSDATAKAGAAQSAAVATAATDATGKANAAQAAAIAAAAADATSKDDAVKAFVASGYATVDEPIGAAAAGAASSAASAAASAATTANAAIPKSTVTTKGDLLAATAAGALARLGVGSNNKILGADSTQATGIRWYTSQETVARALGWVIVTDPQWAGGADPTGASDSTAAILAAAASIGNTVGGGVWVGPGTFTCNTVDGSGNVLAFTSKQMFSFKGSGKGTILRFTSGTATDFIRFDTCTRGSIGGFWIQIVGSGTKVTNALHCTTTSPGSAHQVDISDVVVYAIGGSYRFAHDCATVSGSNVITSATGAFAAGDVGGAIGVNQSLGPINGTVTAVATVTGTISNGGSAITAVTQTIPLAAPLSGVPNARYTIKIDSEIMLVTGGFQTSTLTVSRAVGATSAAASTHADGATVTTYQATLSVNASSSIWPAPARLQSPTTPTMLNGIALGTDHPAATDVDLASVTIRGCTVNTATVAAFVVGNGSYGNVLANVAHGIEASQNLYGLFLNGGGLKVHGGNFSTNGVEVKVGQLCSDPISINALRSEGASMLYDNNLGTTLTLPVAFRDVMVDAFMAPDGVPVRHIGAAPLTLDTVNVLYALANKAVSFGISGTGASTPCNVVGINVVTNGVNSPWPALSTLVRVTSLGGGRLNSSNQTVQTLDGQRIDGPLVRPLSKQTTSGAVTIDASMGNAVVTLNGNATGTTITNPIDAQELEITYVQDATGGRTYAWPTNCKFAGGSAPADTTASKRSSVRFVYDSATTTWNERSRAVAVG